MISRDIFIFANGFFINIILRDDLIPGKIFFFVNLFFKKSIPPLYIGYLIIEFNVFIQFFLTDYYNQVVYLAYPDGFGSVFFSFFFFVIFLFYLLLYLLFILNLLNSIKLMAKVLF